MSYQPSNSNSSLEKRVATEVSDREEDEEEIKRLYLAYTAEGATNGGPSLFDSPSPPPGQIPLAPASFFERLAQRGVSEDAPEHRYRIDANVEEAIDLYLEGLAELRISPTSSDDIRSEYLDDISDLDLNETRSLREVQRAASSSSINKRSNRKKIVYNELLCQPCNDLAKQHRLKGGCVGEAPCDKCQEKGLTAAECRGGIKVDGKLEGKQVDEGKGKEVLRDGGSH